MNNSKINHEELMNLENKSKTIIDINEDDDIIESKDIKKGKIDLESSISYIKLEEFQNTDISIKTKDKSLVLIDISVF